MLWHFNRKESQSYIIKTFKVGYLGVPRLVVYSKVYVKLQ